MLDGIRVKLDMWQIFLQIIVSLTGPRFLHYEPYFSNLNGFETTANEFNMGSVTIHDDENLYDAVFNGLYVNTTGSRQMQRIIEQ